LLQGILESLKILTMFRPFRVALFLLVAGASCVQAQNAPRVLESPAAVNVARGGGATKIDLRKVFGITDVRGLIARFDTVSGAIDVELFSEVTPLTVANFRAYVNGGRYKDTFIHRAMPGFVIQGGGYSAGMLKKQGQMQPIMLESNKGLSNSRGTLAMARTSVFNSATSEFFINLVNNTSLDYQNQSSPGYAVFGAVIEGMAVVDAIAAQPTGFIFGSNDVPLVDSTVILAIQVK